MLKYWPLIVKNSLRNRRRSLLTILSIAFSLCLLGMLMALYHAFYFTEPTSDQALRLVTRNRVSLTHPMPLSYQQKIRGVAGVREIMIFQWYGGTYKDARDPSNQFARFAAEIDKLPAVYPDWKIPPDQLAAVARERTACLVGRKLARRHNFQIGDRIPLTGDIFPGKIELVVRAFYDSTTDNENMVFQWKYLEELMAVNRAEYVSMFVMRAASVDDVPRVATAVDAMFRNSPFQTKTESEMAFAVSFIAFLGNVKLYLLSICGAITFTIMLVSGNTMAMSARERVREVGVLKTLGYTPASILGIILSESVLIALAGGALGLAMALGLCGLVRSMPPMVADLSRFTIPAPVAAICLLLAVLIGLASCWLPAWNAARRPIADALRFDD